MQNFSEEVFYLWDKEYTVRNLTKVVRRGIDDFDVYRLNSYNEFEYDDSVGNESLNRQIEDSVILLPYSDISEALNKVVNDEV